MMNIGGRLTNLERERDRKVAEHLKKAINEAVDRAAAEFRLPRARVWDEALRAFGVIRAADPEHDTLNLSVLTDEELAKLEALIVKCEPGG